MAEPTRVAVACQGGGSHTAFTAGVLQELLAEWDDERFDLVGLSGTSGGAINATAAWYGLERAGREHAIELLDEIWADIAVSGPVERTTNWWLTHAGRLEAMGFPLPNVSPYYAPIAATARAGLRDVVERHIDFEELRALYTPDCPELVVGTVNVNAGEFETFTNADVSADALLASAAVPELFRAVEIHGHYHWDGLFSQNPPVHDLLTVPADRKPEELWIVQINPQTRESEPTTLEEILDRRNELAGNISLNQELRFIETVNEWVEAGRLPESEFTRTDVHRIQLREQFHASTKVDRSAAFVEAMMERGREQAAAFLDGR